MRKRDKDKANEREKKGKKYISNQWSKERKKERERERESGTRTRIRNQYEYLRISFREVYSEDLPGIGLYFFSSCTFLWLWFFCYFFLGETDVKWWDDNDCGCWEICDCLLLVLVPFFLILYLHSLHSFFFLISIILIMIIVVVIIAVSIAIISSTWHHRSTNRMHSMISQDKVEMLQANH